VAASPGARTGDGCDHEDTVTAARVCSKRARRTRLGAEVICCPVVDRGGTVSAMAAKRHRLRPLFTSQDLGFTSEEL